MKKIIYFIVGMLLLTSCEDFLDSSNKTKKDSSNFPQTEADVSQLLTGIYAILGRPEPLGSLFFVSELMSDDRLGGGGPDDKSCKAIDQFKKSSEDMFNNPWRAMYFGVYRSNYLLSNLGQCRVEQRGVEKQDFGRNPFPACLLLFRPGPYVWRGTYGSLNPNR